MAKLPTDNCQDTSSYANTCNGFEDEDYKTFLDLQFDCSEVDIDPMYEIFLKHLRKDGHSYILEMADDHGLPAFVKYHDESESSEEVDIKLQTSSKNNAYKHSRKRNSARKCSHAKGGPSQEPVEISGSMDHESTFGATYSLVDESYEMFLRQVRFEDLSMILEWDSRTFRYEEVNEETSNSSGGQTSEDTVCNGEQGLVPYGSSHSGSDVTEVEDGPAMSCKFNDPFQFEKQLNAILAQPFDQNEYEQLLKEVSDRKPKEKQKELRSKSVSYATDQAARSYLDRHPDLAKQLESAADCHKKLELLRGFFFWLQNLCHEGAFMPWLNFPSTSDTLLTSGYEVVLSLNNDEEDVQGDLPFTSSVEDALV